MERIIRTPSKFTDIYVGDFTSRLQETLELLDQNYDVIVFDLSNTSWISHECLLLFKAVLFSLVDLDIQFRVIILGLELHQNIDIDRRRAVQIYEAWYVWKLAEILTKKRYERSFDISGHFVDKLAKEFNISTTESDIYEKFNITPFVSLPKLSAHDELGVSKLLLNVYNLDNATYEILKRYSCLLPFETGTLSNIITKELYENFLDHCVGGFLGTENGYAFLSISIRKKVKEDSLAAGVLQTRIRKNVEDEYPKPYWQFFQKDKGVYRNDTFLEFSYLDFGSGIANTLHDAYTQGHPTKAFTSNAERDNSIVSYAFHFESSREPFSKRVNERSTIPRGLFDLISIVQRFAGLLTIRSNHAHVIYDFSHHNLISEAEVRIESDSRAFPGTFITIRFPARRYNDPIDTSAIKPTLSLKPRSKTQIFHHNLMSMISPIKRLNLSKSEYYERVFSELITTLDQKPANSLTYIDFNGLEIESGILRKIVFLLISDYRINNSISIVAINPPSRDVLDVIRGEISILSTVKKQFYFHPTPFIFLNSGNVSLYWLGIFSDHDIDKLNQIFFESHDLRLSDFEDPTNTLGNLTYFDAFGNLKSVLGGDELLAALTTVGNDADLSTIKNIITSSITAERKTVYLCPGNYYQYEYMELNEVLANNQQCKYLSSLLYKRLLGKRDHNTTHKYLCLTPNSAKIIDHWITDGHIEGNAAYKFENRDDLYDIALLKTFFSRGEHVILVCEIISTGFLTNLVLQQFDLLGVHLSHIAVLADLLDDTFEPELINYPLIKSKIVCLYQHKLSKCRLEIIGSRVETKQVKIVRINPYTNGIIRNYSVSDSQKALLTNNEFLSLVSHEHIKIGYFRYNNLVHPYFFDMESIFDDSNLSRKILKEIFSKIEAQHLTDINLVCYPRNSAIRKIDFDYIKTSLLKNTKVDILELERFGTSEGWKFPSSTAVDMSYVNGGILILDDGSCTGESLVQMLEDVSQLEPQKIVVVSIVGRLSEHKRAFYGSITSIRVRKSEIPIKILFGSHWHIPTYYLQDSPLTNERSWIRTLKQIQNTPESIVVIANAVLHEIEIKSVSGNDNVHLLSTRTGKPLYKQLAFVRDLIGRVTSYRFHKGDFKYFDSIVQISQNVNTLPDLLKQLELISGVFLHEPYLFERFQVVLPDVTALLRDFVNAILFDKPFGPYLAQIDKSLLHYRWKNKSLIQLMFVLYHGTSFFRLMDLSMLEKMLAFVGDSQSDLNYFLYKLTVYVPLDKGVHASNSYAEKVRDKVNILQLTGVSPIQLHSLKRYSTFINTLPLDNESFSTHLQSIAANYNRLTDRLHHKDSISLQYDILVTYLDQLTQLYTPNLEDSTRRSWEKISRFVENLLAFSFNFPAFFKPLEDRIYQQLEVDSDSLRALHGDISDKIFHIHADTDFAKVRSSIEKLYNGFIESSTEYYNIFHHQITADVGIEISFFLSTLQNTYPSCEFSVINDHLVHTSIVLPRYFLRHVILDELAKNMRHADTENPIILEWQRSQQSLTLTITTVKIIGNSGSVGSGTGLQKLKGLNHMPVELVSYHSIENNPKTFTQTIIFTLA